MKNWLVSGVVIGVVAWATGNFLTLYKTGRDNHLKPLPSPALDVPTPGGPALAEWKGIWSAGNPMPPLIPAPAAAPTDPTPGKMDQLVGKMDQLLTKIDHLEKQLDAIKKGEKTAEAEGGATNGLAGMTLPSGWYLQHPPQYITPSPQIPLAQQTENADSTDKWSSCAVELVAGPCVNPLCWVLNNCQVQTSYSGLPLPSAWYLEHPPEYFPQSPRFPLANELARQEEGADSTGKWSSCAVELVAGPCVNPLCWVLNYRWVQSQCCGSEDEIQRDRISKLINQSENDRPPIRSPNRTKNHPSHLTPNRVDGGFQ
jgi:hypothetical protein